ncbi:MAG: GHKL domain-containing protein [Oscillospiraceae bacterium]|nr:GHKL domain-containing protein [Oscillospiraceae bacterium]
MRIVKLLLPFSVLLLILLLAYGLILFDQPITNQKYEFSDDGIYDIREIDFDNYTYIPTGRLEVINNELLTPEEFEAYDGDNYSHDWSGVEHNSYLTSRITFLVEDNKWYTFTRQSLGHTHRLYVNGAWLADIGFTSADPEKDIPGNGRITFTAQGVDGKIVLVQQSSNHFHRYGEPWGHAYWRIGTGTKIVDIILSGQYQTNIVLGCFLLLAFLFILLFFTRIQNRAALYFSLFCIVWFIRVGVTGNVVFSVLFPQLDWFVMLRLQYISIPVSAALTLAIINILFPKVLHKPVLYIYYGISTVFSVLFIFIDTLPMSHLMDWVYIIYGPGIIYVLVTLIIRQFILRRKIDTPQIYFVFGLIVFFLSVLTDFGYLPTIFLMPQYHLTGVAMLVLAMCAASAIFVATMREKEQAFHEQQRLTTEVAVLEGISQSKTEYYTALSSHITETKRAEHDLRQHLTTIKAYNKGFEHEKLSGYLDELFKSIPDSSNITFCENFAVNSILHYYFSIAKKENIDIHINAEIPADTGINDTDLCIIFGNCIENAIEACCRTDGDRYIKIQSKLFGEMLTIVITNSFDGNIQIENDKFMSQKRKGEGIGISSVKAIVEKYGDSANFEKSNNEFNVKIILCINKE